MGIQNTLRTSVDVAGSFDRRADFRAGLAMVACTQRPCPRCSSSLVPPDEPQGKCCFRYRPDHCYDGTPHNLEVEASKGSGYIDCFRGTDLRRTHITCGAWVVTMICGTSLGSYSTYFFQQAGLSVTYSFRLSLGLYGIGAVGTVLSWILLNLFGRRTLYLSGLSTIFIFLLSIGFSSLAGKTNVAAQWAISSILLAMVFAYNCAVGPVSYTLVTEMPSTRLKTKTVVLARSSYILLAIITNTITPRMLNPTAWDWGAKSAFFWSGSCAICLVWVFFMVPEPKGRTYGELDILFKERVPTRKFKDMSISPALNAEADKTSILVHDIGDKLQSS